MIIVRKKTTNKKSVIIPFILYIFTTTVFISLDFSFQENFNIFLNIFFLFGSTVIFVSIFRFMFEAILIKITDHFLDKKFDIQTIIHFQGTSLYIPSLIVTIFIIIQFIFIKESATVYQAIVLNLAQFVYMLIFIKKVNRNAIYIKLNIALFLYMLLYFTFQLITLP